MMRRIIELIPNTITSLNLISGCVAIWMSFNYNVQIGCLSGMHWAMIAIAAAAVFDFMDGAAARALKAFSPLGGDLDSLSDLVSFGVAPAMLMLNAMLEYGSYTWPVAAVFLIPVFGALRLARFNNDAEQATFFRGLPIPANALFWIGVAGWIDAHCYPGWVVMWALTAFMCWAMVGNFKMFSLKFKNFDFHENLIRYVMVVVTIVSLAIYGISGFIWAIVLYIILSLLRQHRI